MGTSCPVCDKNLERRFRDHMIKAHGFEYMEADGIYVHCLHLTWRNTDPAKADAAQNEINKILDVKFPERIKKNPNRNLLEISEEIG